MPSDNENDPIWSRVLALANDCQGESNSFVVVHAEAAVRPSRPLYILIHPGDVVQSKNDVYGSENAEDILAYSAGCQADMVDDIERVIRAGWDVAVLHRFSSSYGFGVSNSLQEYEEAVDAIHENGVTLYGDNLDDAANWLLDTHHAKKRPAIVISGAWSDASTGCVTHVGRTLQRHKAKVHLAASACISPDGSGREWKPKLPRLTSADYPRLAASQAHH